MSPTATGTALRLASSASTRWASTSSASRPASMASRKPRWTTGSGTSLPTMTQASVLPQRAAEVAAGEVAVGMAVDGQALAGVQQLDQQRRGWRRRRRRGAAEEALRVGLDRLAQRPARPPAGSGRRRPTRTRPWSSRPSPRGGTSPPVPGVVPRSSSMADPPR